MKNLFLLTLLCVSSLLFVGCNQDPYPTEGTLRVTEPIEADEPLPPLTLKLDDVVGFKEGRFRKYKIRVEVEEPGVPIVTVKGLPEGAEFNAEDFTISWRPTYFDGNDPNDPTIKQQIYPIQVTLRSTALPKDAEVKRMSLLVEDIPQIIDIQTNRSGSVDEGKKFTEIITIKNVDYPQGPFKVVTKGMPSNTEVKELAPDKFELSFSPDYFHVNRKVGRNKRYQGKIIVANPANHLEEKDFPITVNDVRRETKIVAPEELIQGLDVSIQVSSYDLNREVAPEIELLSRRPNFGTFETKLIKDEKSFNSALNISWKDIPPAYNGTKQTLRFRSCVLDSSGNMNNCEEDETKIKIVVRDRTPPSISRTDWPTNELIYLGFDEKLEKRLTVKDREDPKLQPKVEIFPESLRKYVSWRNNRLNMQFKEAGVFQFNVIATSDYNMSSAESFIVEVFPENRNGVLLFADSTRDPEVVFYRSTFGTMDIMNPAIQDVSLRNISDRKTLVITTSTLLDKSYSDKIQEAIDKIDNIVIATPLIDNLPEKFLKTLVEEYDLFPIGRLSQQPNIPGLDKMKFVTTSQFAKPKGDIGLKGTTSEESKDPMLFNGGLFDTNKNCKGIVGISATGNNPLPIGLACKRKNGGRITVMGTEWADLLVGEDDKEIPVKWFNTMLNGNF